MYNIKARKLSKQTWVSAAFLLIFLSLLSKGFGFLREVLVAKTFGVSYEVDAYLVAVTVPAIIGAMIGSAFGISLIPLYQRIADRDEPFKASNLVKALFTFTMLISIIFIAVIYVMPGVVIKTIAPSLPEPTASLAVRLVKWLSFLVLGIALFNVLSSVYNALHHFRIPAITDLTSNLCVIIALVVFSSLWGISALAIGLIGGTYLVIFFLIFHLSKKGFIGINMVFTSNEFKQLIIFSAPILGYLFFSQVSVVIENFFASSLKVGSISALGYARQISNILPTLMATNIAKATFPTFSTLYLEHKIEGLRDLVVKLTKQVIIYFIPTSFVLVFFRKEIIRMVYMRGAFDASALNLTSTAFLFYAAGLTVYVLLPIFIRLCYAFSDAFSPLMATIIGIVCMSLLNYLLTPVWGIMGIAFSSSLAVLLTLFVIAIPVRKRLQGLDLTVLGKVSARSFACASLAILPFFKLKLSHSYGFILLALVYFILYFTLGWVIMKEEISSVWMSFKRMRPGNVK